MHTWRRTYRIADLAISLEGTDPLLETLARSVYGDAPTAVGAGCRVYRLERAGAQIVLRGVEGEELIRAAGLNEAFAELEWFITSLAMECSPRYLQVHAAVTVRDGRGVLMVGAADSGKTTITLALALRGAAVFTDEVAMIRPQDGRVVPFPRDLALHWRTSTLLGGRRPWRPVRSWKCFPGYLRCSRRELGSALPAGTAPIDLIVLLQRSLRGAIGVRPAGQAEAAHGLLEQAFNLARLGRAGMALVGDLVRRAPALHLRWRDAHEAAEALLRHLGGGGGG